MSSQMAVKMLGSQFTSYSDPKKAWGYTITNTKGSATGKKLKGSVTAVRSDFHLNSSLTTLMERTPVITVQGLLLSLEECWAGEKHHGRL